MRQVSMNGSPSLPTTLSTKLSGFRRRVWIVKLAEGVFASLFGLAVSYLVILGLDRLMETPAWLRGTVLAMGAAVPGLGLPLKWHRWVWRQRQLEDAAKLLRWKFPRLGDQLLGIVELAREESAVPGRSQRLVQAAMVQADEAVRQRDLSHAVPKASHRWWAWAAAGALALTLAGFIFMQEAALNAFQRWLVPWRDAERFTYARIEPLPDPWVIPLAEPLTLPVQLSPDSVWKPRRARARIDAQPRIHADRAEGGSFTFALHPQAKDGHLRLAVGDVRETIRLQPRPRPELKDLKVHVKLPDYLRYESEPVIDVRGGSVSVLRGAEAAFEVTTSRGLVEARMDGRPVEIEGESLLTESTPVGEPRSVTFTWKDGLGLTALAPLVLSINSVEDESPTLVARRESLERVVLDSEVVVFELSARDDFGIREVGLQWRGVGREDGASEQGSKTTAAGAPERRELSGPATFCAAREGVRPQTLELRAWALDYLEGREPSRSASFILHVLDPTDHALWVTSQMGKWLAAARETYEREQQLHQTNKELRALSPEDLDRPENRRRLAAQAAAETANAERLTSLNQAGRKLIEHATKNPEFDAARLESWATLLQSLQDIAANRMPSVAELLKRAADAKADAPSSSRKDRPGERGRPGEGTVSPGETGPKVAAGQSSPTDTSSAAAPPTPDGEPASKQPAPSIELTESTMNQPQAADFDAPPTAPKPPGAGSLGLPANSLAAAPNEEPPQSSAQKSLQQGVTEQRDLLAEFAKVSDQLSEILASLEASTFVKRLKAASRRQMTLASNMRAMTLGAFGIERQPRPPAEETRVEKSRRGREPASPEASPPYVTEHAPVAAERARRQSEVVKVIKSDMEAYIQRRPDRHFKRVIAEMRETEVVSQLERVAVYAADNLSGSTIHAAEFWADTFDRWAEEMVKAGSCSNCSSASADSLPPEVVLKVMQALRDEIALRDETRELENARPGAEKIYFIMRAARLGDEQARIRRHTQSAMADIRALPDGARRFAEPLQLLGAVTRIMEEARLILETAETGAPAIAAETEVIELLLQTKRQNPNGGGGGGDSPGGGGTAAAASLAALSHLGPGSDGASVVDARAVGQATGSAGRAFPEEFKTGLDAYFRNLEVAGTP